MINIHCGLLFNYGEKFTETIKENHNLSKHRKHMDASTIQLLFPKAREQKFSVRFHLLEMSKESHQLGSKQILNKDVTKRHANMEGKK